MIKRLVYLILSPLLAWGSPALIKEMQSGVFYIEDGEGGIEEFGISESKWNLYQHQDGTWEFVLNVATDKDIKRSDSRAGVYGNSKPKFTATAILKPAETKLKGGQVINQKESYDKIRELNLSWFTYGGGGSLEKLKVEVLDAKDDVLELKLTGQFEGDGEIIALQAKFKKDSTLKRSVK
jgi:hypothetical protein